MSDNPFDVFAADFKAAIPSTDDKNATANPNQPINIMAQPEPAPVPVMNAPAAPIMNQQPPQQQPPMGMNGMGMGGMGMGMNPGMNGMAQPPQQQGMYGGGGYGMGAPYGVAPPAPTMGGMPGPPGAGAMVPSAQPSNPYAMNMGGMYGQQPQQPPPPQQQQQQQQPPPPQPNPPMPYGGGPPAGQPPAQPPSTFGASPPPPMTAAVSGDPFGAPPAAAPAVPALPSAADPFGAAPPVPPVSPTTEFGAVPIQNGSVSAQSSDPYGTSAPPPPPPTTSADPWAQPAPPPPQPTGGAPPGAPGMPANNAIVPVPNGAPSDDPFGVFNSGPSNDAISVETPAPKNYTQAQIHAAADSPWDFNSTSPSQHGQDTNTPGDGGGSLLGGGDGLVPVAEEQKTDELPPGGEWYDARIFTPTLGVMFFKPQELTDSLFLQTERSLVDGLNDRPVVAFIVEGSSARAAGVELGHVLLKVNGIDVKNPKEASRLIKEGPRPLPLLFYVPDTNVVVAEGEHMVKYDTRETMAPNSAKDWKPKYVVIGGIIAQPWMMNMYRSKSEYDIAVIETQARRPVSVKVKQFSLQGARIQNDWQGPQMVKYKNKLHPWKYIVILPISRNPIKISSPNLTQLKPVHEGIRRVLMAQQRYAPNPNRGDSYGGGGPPQHHPQHPQQYPPQQGGGGGGYGGPPGGGGYGGPPPPQQQQYNGGGGYGQDQYSTSGGTASARRRTPQY